MIGTYVDKLEERLADFAVARRDIEQREQQCQKAEKKAEEAEHEKEKLLKRIGELDDTNSKVNQPILDFVGAFGIAHHASQPSNDK